MSANRVKKVTRTTTHYRVERKDKAGRWTPIQNIGLVNYSSTLEGIKNEVVLFNRYRRHWSRHRKALPTPRRYVKITTQSTQLISKERVK